jgi:hypothetical protein
MNRQKIAAHWLGKLQWFTDRLEPEADETLLEIIAACQGHYELHA